MINAITGKIKIVGIIASLAALALVLSPTFSLLQIPGKNNSADNPVNDATFLKDDTVVENVGNNNDLAACSSLNDRVHQILASNSSMDKRKLASDTLIAEFCSRPVLIHEIMSADSKTLSLVAYACDASSRKIGTPATQESLADYKAIYCDSARKLIVNETNTFLASVEQFRTEYLPLLQAGLEDTGNRTSSQYANGDGHSNFTLTQGQIASQDFNATSIEITLDAVTQSLQGCLKLVDAGEYYPAAKSFDNASKKFVGLFQQEAHS